MISIRHSIPCLLALALASCGGNEEPETPATGGFKPLSQRLDESNGYTQDADGNWSPRNDKRSSFELMGQSPYATSTVQKNEYRTGEFNKRSWWGNKDYKTAQYQGNTDASSYQKSTKDTGKRALEGAGNPLSGGNYTTSGYRTGAANESRTSSFQKNDNAEIEYRRDVFKQPNVVDWRQQRSLSVDQSRGLLGR